MLSRLISGVCKLFRSNSMPCRTHVDLDLQRWDCREVSHAHQVVGCAGEAEDPVHFAHSAMPHFAQQGDRLQPAETLFDALSLLLTETIAGMLCRAPVDCAPCSLEVRPWARACSTTCARNCLATSASSNRSRFLVKLVASQTSSSKFNPTNQRNNML